MEKYVVGFLFNRGKVALIRKIKPDWQKGRLNGIGGHIEKGETPFAAMVREFREEAGCDIFTWHEFVTVKGKGYRLHCFRAKKDGAVLKSMTKEKVSWHYWHLPTGQWLDNLIWLVPMANYKFALRGEIWHDDPEC